jgi:hypothetical protein
MVLLIHDAPPQSNQIIEEEPELLAPVAWSRNNACPRWSESSLSLLS